MNKNVEVWIRVHDPSLVEPFLILIYVDTIQDTYNDIIQHVYSVLPTELAVKGQPILVNNGKRMNPSTPLAFYKFSVYVNLNMVFSNPKLERQNSYNQLKNTNSRKWWESDKRQTVRRAAGSPKIYDDYKGSGSPIYVPPHRRDIYDDFEDWFDDADDASMPTLHEDEVIFSNFWDDDGCAIDA